MRRIHWLAVVLFIAVAGVDDIMTYKERLEILLLQDRTVIERGTVYGAIMLAIAAKAIDEIIDGIDRWLDG